MSDSQHANEVMERLLRDHILQAIAEVDEEGIGAREDSTFYDVVYHGNRYPPKLLISLAARALQNEILDRNAFSGGVNSKCFKTLELHGFKIVDKPKSDLAIPAYQVMVYSVSSSASANASKLYSSDGTYFYWNQDKFENLEDGEAVFVINLAANELLYTLVDKKGIEAIYAQDEKSTRFTDKEEQFVVDGREDWTTFIRLNIRERVVLQADWKWYSTGSSEITYLRSERIKPDMADKNKIRVNQLLEACVGNETIKELQACHVYLDNIKEDSPLPHKPTRTPRFWYVFQGESYSRDHGTEYLRAPKINAGGNSSPHHIRMKELEIGDYIFHHSNGIRCISRVATEPYDFYNEHEPTEIKRPSWRADVELLKEFDPLITPARIVSKKPSFDSALADSEGPYTNAGTGKQGYLWEFNAEAAAIVRELLGYRLPDEVERWLSVDAPVPPIPKPSPVDAVDVLEHISRYMTGQGYTYSKADIANFYLCMKTKPFVILAGVSGTGKTQLVRQFAKAIGATDSCRLIPVRPDWTDNSDLIGYKNLQGEFQRMALLEVILEARVNLDKPYFVILDEMNLARVEYYFSDFLSVIETRELNANKEIVTDPLLTEASIENGDAIGIPANLLIVGTVNMDETTHPFSRKVLDRANSIEMNQIDLEWVETSSSGLEPLENIPAELFFSSLIHSNQLSEQDKATLKPTLNFLVQLNGILQQADLQFGYRVRDEVCFYILHCNSIKGLITEEDALDYQVMQKILPRINGSSIAVLRVILQLMQALSCIDTFKEGDPADEIIKTVSQEKSKFPRSVQKLCFMLRRFNDDGFTSFWL